MSYSTPASERQISYVSDLLATRVVSDEVRATVGDPAHLSKSAASAAIDTLSALPRAPRAGGSTTTIAPVLTDEGIYFHDHEVYKVKQSAAGRMYALKLVGSSWSYDAAHVRGLLPEHRITMEQAAEFGIRTGVCAICGIPLTNLDSLARGIGPVCAARDW